MRAEAKVFSLVGLILLTGLPFFLQGCGSTPKKIAFKTLEAVGEAENTAMRTAARAKVAGQLTDGQWQQVAQIHVNFCAAYNAACDVAAFDLNASVPPQVSAIVVDLIALLNQFGVQLNL